VEILVVVLLVGVTVSFIAVNLGPGDREVVGAEAARLAVSLQQAQDEAVMTGATLAWRGGTDGYQYLRRGPDRNWLPIDGEDAFSPYRLALPVRLVDVEVGGEKLGPGGLVIMSPSALASPVRIILEANGERRAVEVGTSARVVTGGGV
jgi:type II secretion system protein H